MKILFIPVSGPVGAGEYIRSLTIAQKLREDLEAVEIRFLINRHAVYVEDVPFPVTLLDASPTKSVNQVRQAIEQEKPDLCIFDSGGRTSLLKFLKRQSIPVIYISSRDSTRKKAFRWGWLGMIRQHWIVQPKFAHGDLGFMERLKLKVTGAPPPVFLQTVYPESQRDRRNAFGQSIGLVDKPYILFSSGGGGKREKGPNAPTVFADTAAEVASCTGQQCVVIMGPNYPGELPMLPNVITLKAVENTHFIDLLHDAEMLVIGGGSSLAQGIAERKIILAAPAAADQAKRIGTAVAAGLVQQVNTVADEMAEAVVMLQADSNKKQQLLTAIDSLDLKNGALKVPELVKQIMSSRQ